MKNDQIILKKVYVCSNKCNKLSQNYPIIDVIAKIVAGVYKLCVSFERLKAERKNLKEKEKYFLINEHKNRNRKTNFKRINSKR